MHQALGDAGAEPGGIVSCRQRRQARAIMEAGTRRSTRSPRTSPHGATPGAAGRQAEIARLIRDGTLTGAGRQPPAAALWRRADSGARGAAARSTR
ncbi:MAG: hypothetical protein MZV49_20940 [Rhodopseudomonas palustris]|nr:hypothetical protein [Rhodopseudomonas palustris]